jgi:hypothetical protein
LICACASPSPSRPAQVQVLLLRVKYRVRGGNMVYSPPRQNSALVTLTLCHLIPREIKHRDMARFIRGVTTEIFVLVIAIHRNLQFLKKIRNKLLVVLNSFRRGTRKD